MVAVFVCGIRVDNGDDHNNNQPNPHINGSQSHDFGSNVNVSINVMMTFNFVNMKPRGTYEIMYLSKKFVVG